MNDKRWLAALCCALLMAAGTACGDDDSGDGSDDDGMAGMGGDGDGDASGDGDGDASGDGDGDASGDGDGDASGDGDGDASGDGDGDAAEPLDPADAPRVEVDRFSEAAGTLMVRTDDNGLPGAGEPIDFDQAPFITTGLGPDGSTVRYYNFDVMPTGAAPIFVLFREGEDMPVEGQLNLIDVIPGDEGYNDFWHPHKVTVPADYVANTLTNVEDIMAGGYEMERLPVIVNCPVVPEGSTAELRHGDEDNGLVMGWYEDQVVTYFEFGEAMFEDIDLPDEGHPEVPLSPIYVTFNLNPDEDGGGPPSGFVTESDSEQTHNVVATVPGDEDYSPLWLVNIYDNADFDDVSDLDSAEAANILATGAANVNCPVVETE